MDYMCRGDDHVNYDVYMNIRRLFRNKLLHYQVGVAGKYYFLKILLKSEIIFNRTSSLDCTIM